jgi:hypothetical protein
MLAPACGVDISRPASTSKLGGAQSARPASLSAATACRVRFKSPVVTLIRRSRSSIGRSPVGSSSTMPLIWLPSRPWLSSARTLTGQKTRTRSGTTSPRALNQRCSPSDTTARTASLTVDPKRSFNALNADSGTFKPRPVRCGPILRLKNRSGRRVTILPLRLKRPDQGRRVVFQIAGTLVLSMRVVGLKFQSIGLMSCQFVGAGRGFQTSAGGSGE